MRRLVIDCATGVTTAVDLSAAEVSQVGQNSIDAAALAQAEGESRRRRALIREAVTTALAENRLFLASSPKTAQLGAQVAALTRQTNGVIQMLLDQFDGPDGG